MLGRCHLATFLKTNLLTIDTFVPLDVLTSFLAAHFDLLYDPKLLRYATRRETSLRLCSWCHYAKHYSIGNFATGLV